MSESDALRRYVDSMRPRRIRYAAVIAVVVAVLAVFVGVEWSRGETAHVTLHTVRTPPAALAVSTPAAVQRLAWRTSDRLAIGTPVAGGTVVTFSEHTVRGRDARTGAATWSYTRTDRTVCTAAQLSGTTVAVYAVHGDCDEVTALNSGTGARTWTRTLDKDGMPINGRPTYAWITGSGYDTLVVTAHGSADDVIYAIDPGGGLDRWTYTRHGCRIGRVVIGTSGVLISQDCTHPACGDKKMCVAGPQLLLRDARANNDDSKPDGDHITWLERGNTDVPVSAGQVIGAIDPATHTLHRYRADTGRSLGTSPLPAGAGTAAAAASATAVDTVTADVLWVAGTTYAFTAGRAEPLWSTRTAAAPTVLAARPADSPPPLPSAWITVPTAAGVAQLDGSSGGAVRSLALPRPSGTAASGPATEVALPLGAGFLIGTPHGVVAYR